MDDVTPYHPGDEELKRILGDGKTVAVVGLSNRTDRPAYGVAAYLKDQGYRVIPVHPSEEEQVLGEKVHASLQDVPEPIDVVDVFVRADNTPPVAEDAVDVGAKVLWLQEGIVSDEARQIAEGGGLEVVMGICIKKTHARLGAEG